MIETRDRERRVADGTRALGGLAIALGAPAIYTFVVRPTIVEPRLGEVSAVIVGFAAYWVLALGVVLYTRYGERRPLSSIGWTRLPTRAALVAVGLGVLLSLLVPLLTLMTSALLPPSDTGTITQVATAYPWWVLLLSVVTAGVTEEVLYRGYAFERLRELTGSAWAGGALALVGFTVVHLAGWDVGHVLGVVVPLGAVLTVLYARKRNVVFVVIVHVIVNLPLVGVALVA